MSEEKTNQTVTLQDGRTLGFAEYSDGDSQKTIIYFNGSGEGSTSQDLFRTRLSPSGKKRNKSIDLFRWRR